MNAIPKWMPSDDERIGAARISAFDGMYYRTGLRAQIAVLEEEDALYGDGHDGQNTRWRQAKIASLRKELGNE